VKLIDTLTELDFVRESEGDFSNTYRATGFDLRSNVFVNESLSESQVQVCLMPNDPDDEPVWATFSKYCSAVENLLKQWTGKND
jgi:hypothetical protein